MTKDEALKLALEALDCIYSPLHVREIEKVGNAMKVIKEALAQPEQEPVAWVNLNELSEQINSVSCGTVYGLPPEAEGSQPLYPAPPQRTWVGLTEEEIDIWNIVAPSRLRDFVRCIEAKLKEKNGC